MNIIIIQENGRHNKNRSFRECFCLQRAFKYHGHGCDVWGLGHADYEYGIIPDWNSYDLIINAEQYDEQNWVPKLNKIQTKKFLWSIDAHCKGLQSYLNVAHEGNYDLILQSTPEFIVANSTWFPNCYDDTIIYNKNLEKKYDVGFCGNINNRGTYISILNSKFNFKLDEFIIGDDMVNAINSYKIHFNANIGIDINYRNFETIGCGTCLLTSYNIHYEKLGLVDMKNCLTYSSVEEMIEKTKLLLNDSDLIKNISNAGLELANKHTYKERAKIILDLI